LRKQLPTVLREDFQKARHYYSARALEASDTEEKDRYDKYQSEIDAINKKLRKAPFQASVTTQCQLLFGNEEFLEQLNEKHNLIGFNNGVFDLDLMESREGRPDDMISLTTKYDYTDKVDPLIRQELMNFVFSIQDSKEMGEFTLMTLGASLHGGKEKQRVYFWIGSGGNGKSILMIIYGSALGDYHVAIPMEVFTTAKTSSNAAHPEIARSKGRRGCSACEPAEGARLQIHFIKEITGGEPIYTRGLYENGTEFVPQTSVFLLMNMRPTMSGNDDGFKRRLRNIHFPYQFREKEDLSKNIKKIDTSWEEKSKMVKYHQQFMLILLEYYERFKNDGYVIHTPKQVLHDTNKYLNQNNYVYNFVNETYDIVEGEDKKIVWKTATDIWVDWKAWAREQDTEARLLKKSNFIEQMEYVLKMMDMKYETKTTRAGGSHNCNVVFGLKSKQEDCMINDNYE
jgi:P4 family phage/plasmid primase-like protien